MTVELEHVTQVAEPIEVAFDLCFDIDAHLTTSGLIGLGARQRHGGVAGDP